MFINRSFFVPQFLAKPPKLSEGRWSDIWIWIFIPILYIDMQWLYTLWAGAFIMALSFDRRRDIFLNGFVVKGLKGYHRPYLWFVILRSSAVYIYVRCPHSACLVSACVYTLNIMHPCDLPSFAKSSSTDYFRCFSINTMTTAITWQSRLYLDCIIGRLAAGTHVNYGRDLNNQICNSVVISKTLVQEINKKP